jgi:hypothetical protein
VSAHVAGLIREATTGNGGTEEPAPAAAAAPDPRPIQPYQADEVDALCLALGIGITSLRRQVKKRFNVDDLYALTADQAAALIAALRKMPIPATPTAAGA